MQEFKESISNSILRAFYECEIVRGELIDLNLFISEATLIFNLLPSEVWLYLEYLQRLGKIEIEQDTTYKTRIAWLEPYQAQEMRKGSIIALYL